jgi:phage terminase large subunit-like protein
VAFLRRQYENTSIGRQELLGELLLDVDEALWRREWIDAARVTSAPELVRLVVAVDPSVGGSAETGVIAAGKDERGDVYVLADYSLRAMPEQWASRVVAAYDVHQADAVVAEVNQGGALVASVLTSVGFLGKLKTVVASRAKATRAEPVSALYQQGRVHHVGVHSALEDQLCSWVPGQGASPDRLDALVWSCTELVLQPRKEPPAWYTNSMTWKPPRSISISANGLLITR